MLYTLRPYQLFAENEIRTRLRQGYRAPLLVMPTGSGKTVIFTSVATQAAALGNRSLIVVHRSYLWKQVSQKLNEAGAPHGIIAPGHTQTNDKIQVASVDTLIRRLDRVPVPGMIIYDEAHHVIGGNKWGKIASYFPDALILGVTATACRTSGQGLGVQAGGYFDTLIQGAQILDLTPEYLSPYKLYAPDIGVDLTGVRRVAGDYNKGELIERVDKKRIYGAVPAHYKKLCYGVPAIAFCVSVKHAEHVADEFNSAGIPAAPVSGKTSEKQRTYLFKGLAEGKFLVLCSCDLVSEGFDVPVCGAAIGLRPTQSLTLCLQQWGRAGRVAPGKKYAYILDHVGNYLRHGMPDAPREWSLDGVKWSRKQGEETAVNIRTCPACFHVHTPAPACPECGHVYVAGEELPKTVEAELREIKTAREAEKKARSAEVKNADTLEDLQRIGEERGYKKNWAKFVWNMRKQYRRRFQAPINLKHEE